MRFYHGSTEDNIKELSTGCSEGKVCFTSSKIVALTYISKSFPNMFRTQGNIEVYDEIVDGLFQNVTKEQAGFVYTVEVEDYHEIPFGPNCGHKGCFYSLQNTKVVKKEKITDLYEALLKYIKLGQFKVITPRELGEERCEKMIENISNIYDNLEKPLKRKRDFMYLIKKD